MNTAKIPTTRTYRTYLLNKAAKTGDYQLAELVKCATATTIKNLYNAGYMLPGAACNKQNAK